MGYFYLSDRRGGQNTTEKLKSAIKMHNEVVISIKIFEHSMGMMSVIVFDCRWNGDG